MIYQSTIQLKGRDKLIYVSKKAAEQVAAIFDNQAIEADYPVNIANQHRFRKGEIKNIDILSDIDKPVWEKSMAEFYEEEKKSRELFLKRTPAQKAAETGMFELLYKCAIGETPSAEIIAQARSIQERFFIKNPNRTMCDPHDLTPIIPIVRGKKITIWANGGLGIVERAVMMDMQLSK